MIHTEQKCVGSACTSGRFAIVSIASTSQQAGPAEALVGSRDLKDYSAGSSLPPSFPPPSRSYICVISGEEHEI